MALPVIHPYEPLPHDDIYLHPISHDAIQSHAPPPHCVTHPRGPPPYCAIDPPPLTPHCAIHPYGPLPRGEL